jgi:hypothetical protein
MFIHVTETFKLRQWEITKISVAAWGFFFKFVKFRGKKTQQIQCVQKVAVRLGCGTRILLQVEVAIEVCCCFTVFSC